MLEQAGCGKACKVNLVPEFYEKAAVLETLQLLEQGQYLEAAWACSLEPRLTQSSVFAWGGGQSLRSQGLAVGDQLFDRAPF